MSNEKQQRVTKKSRMVSEIAECIVDIVAAGNSAPSKGMITECVVTNSLGADASAAIHSLLTDEVANEVDRYFYDSVKAAADVIDQPWHLTTKEFYRKRNKPPESKEQAKSRVATFGNGRRGPAMGVRFVPEGAIDDLYLAVAMEKRFDNTKSIVDATQRAASQAVDSGALPDGTIKKLENK